MSDLDRIRDDLIGLGLIGGTCATYYTTGCPSYIRHAAAPTPYKPPRIQQPAKCSYCGHGNAIFTTEGAPVKCRSCGAPLELK